MSIAGVGFAVERGELIAKNGNLHRATFFLRKYLLEYSTYKDSSFLMLHAKRDVLTRNA